MQYMQFEIDRAREGKPAWMILKMNSLVDKEMIAKLYEASMAGVKIRLIVRGICSLIPEISAISDNIEVVSIVDRYLEHSRVFIFCNGGQERFYISSGDWMYRNLDYRSEVAVPIIDKVLQRQLMQYVDIQWNDTVKARILNAEQDNRYRRSLERKKSVRSQTMIFRWTASLARHRKAE